MGIAMPLFERFVEPGRLCRISYGADVNKMCTIIDIIDEKRVVVDGPASLTGVMRQPMPIKWLNLTDFKSELKRGSKEKALKSALKESDALASFTKSGWGAKIAAKAKKATLTDYERFRLMLAKKTKAKLVAKKIKK